MPAGGLVTAGAIMAVGGIIKGITGLSQKHKAHKILNGLTYPTESLPTEVSQNQDMATRMADTGLPSAQYNQAKQNIFRQQNALLGASSDRRGGLMGIGALQQRGDDALLNLDVANANARMSNQRNLMNVNNQVAGWKDKIWDNNVRQKYNQQYGYAMQLLGSGNQNFSSGIDQLSSGALMGASANNSAQNGGGGSYINNQSGLYNYQGDNGYNANNTIG